MTILSLNTAKFRLKRTILAGIGLSAGHDIYKTAKKNAWRCLRCDQRTLQRWSWIMSQGVV